MVTASINLIPEAPLADLVAIARHAEQVGFRRCWVYDEGLATRDVYIVLAAIAQATTLMEIGTGITNPYTRHPATTAATTATLDVPRRGVPGGRVATVGISRNGQTTR